MILYTSGSTGLPKGAMYTERMVAWLWTNSLTPDFEDIPVFNVKFMPLNHLGGRIPLASAFQAGGTSYFVPETDLSTLFDDWNLLRPTEMGMVPRVAEMLYQRYQSAVERIVSEGGDRGSAEAEALFELRDQVLGGRVITKLFQHGAAGRRNEGLYRGVPGRARAGRLRADRGLVRQQRRPVSPASGA